MRKLNDSVQFGHDGSTTRRPNTTHLTLSPAGEYTCAARAAFACEMFRNSLEIGTPGSLIWWTLPRLSTSSFRVATAPGSSLSTAPTLPSAVLPSRPTLRTYLARCKTHASTDLDLVPAPSTLPGLPLLLRGKSTGERASKNEPNFRTPALFCFVSFQSTSTGFACLMYIKLCYQCCYEKVQDLKFQNFSI